MLMIRQKRCYHLMAWKCCMRQPELGKDSEFVEQSKEKQAQTHQKEEDERVKMSHCSNEHSKTIQSDVVMRSSSSNAPANTHTHTHSMNYFKCNFVAGSNA